MFEKTKSFLIKFWKVSVSPTNTSDSVPIINDTNKAINFIISVKTPTVLPHLRILRFSSKTFILNSGSKLYIKSLAKLFI